MMPGSKGHCATGGCAWYTKFGLISACFGWYWRLHLAPFLCMLTFQNQKRPFDPSIMTFLEHAVPYIESKPEAGYYDPDLEMKYAKVDEGIVVLYMTEWYLCVPADTAISD